MPRLLLPVALLAACNSQEILRPNPPPKPPSAELWPLGGHIYYGTPLPEDHHSRINNTDAAPAEDTAPLEDAVPAEDTVSAEDAPTIQDAIAPTEDAPTEAPAPAPAPAPADGADGEE